MAELILSGLVGLLTGWVSMVAVAVLLNRGKK